jgi:hypothetical protein
MTAGALESFSCAPHGLRSLGPPTRRKLSGWFFDALPNLIAEHPDVALIPEIEFLDFDL